MAAMPSSTSVPQLIAECISKAQSNSCESHINALETLSSLTKISSHNRSLVAQNSDAIPTILKLSKSQSSSTQCLSLSILFNLSLNPNLKQPLAAQLDTISHLNSLILSPPTALAGKLAASLICSLAVLDKNKAKFGVAGTVEALIEVLRNSDDLSSAAHHHLSSLHELVQFHGNCTLALRTGAVPLLVWILRSPAEELGGSCLAILALLARYEEGIGTIRSVHGVVGLLVDGLRRGCMMSRESAAEILIRLFEGSEEFVREAVEKYEFSCLLADLSIRGSSKAREKAGVLMKIMMEANLDCYVEGNPMIL